MKNDLLETFFQLIDHLTPPTKIHPEPNKGKSPLLELAHYVKSPTCVQKVYFDEIFCHSVARFVRISYLRYIPFSVAARKLPISGLMNYYLCNAMQSLVLLFPSFTLEMIAKMCLNQDVFMLQSE